MTAESEFIHRAYWQCGTREVCSRAVSRDCWLANQGNDGVLVEARGRDNKEMYEELERKLNQEKRMHTPCGGGSAAYIIEDGQVNTSRDAVLTWVMVRELGDGELL